MTKASPPTYEETIELIRQHEVGRRAYIETPFGPRLICYADLTATGRYLHFVEAWFRRVRPFFANTHTAVSTTGRIMTQLREEARSVIRRAVNAGEEDEVVFVGSGATAAINKMVGLLGLRIDEPLDRQYGLSASIPAVERPVIFVGPYEHHSNHLPWLESIADLVEIPADAAGQIDIDVLEGQLRAHASRPLRIGSFSAASNVTGTLTDVPAIARLLHQQGAYAFFDYAAAAPYVPIDMHPADEEARIDALFISAHKFVGGPNASGILVAHRSLFRGRVPERPGGGTVGYVTGVSRDDVDYLERLAEREEGGTPAIASDLRAGIAFLVKEMVGPQAILEHELEVAKRVIERLGKHPRIRVLGAKEGLRLPVISFSVEELHHDLASALLDHLFGIQNRAGCSCAGPYGHRLLGIDRPTSERYRALVRRGVEGIKPGWVRVTFPHYAAEEDIDFILSAIEFIADHGKHFIPVYRFGWRDGVWRHCERHRPDRPPIELTVEALREAAQSFAAGDHETPISAERIRTERARYFEQAHDMAAELVLRAESNPVRWNPPTGDSEVDALVWFSYVHADPL